MVDSESACPRRHGGASWALHGAEAGSSATGEAAGGDGVEPRARRLAGLVVNGYLTHHLGAPLRAWELVPR